MRGGTKAVLAAADGLEVVGGTEDGLEALGTFLRKEGYAAPTERSV